MADNPQKILGIDPGRKRIGLAIADTLLKVATGFDIVEYKGRERFLQRLGRIIDEEKITSIVMGLPRNMNGSEGDAAKNARRLADSIKGRFDIDVILMDERLTTQQAVRQIHETGGRTGDNKGRVDMLSAALILQSYLDGLPKE
jgi:putative Holliday junction resolvase